MFKELGQMASLFKNLPRIKEEVDKMQERVALVSADGDAGAGMVRVRVNGKMEIVSCQIAPEAMSDREMLEGLVKSAVNQALERVRKQIADETGKLAGGLGLPAGMGLPGLG